MRFYPDIPTRRAATLARDVLVVGLVALFAWLGVRVHDRVDDLATLGRGVRDAGAGVDDSFRRAGDAVDGVPLVGGRLREALGTAGAETGGNVEAAGRQGEQAAEDLARLLGWLTFGVPTLLLLGVAVPLRVIQVRRLTAASRALGAPATPERRRLLAMRAAFHLPYAALLDYTRDPLGDLEAGRHEALIAAAYAEAGLRPPREAAGPGGRP